MAPCHLALPHLHEPADAVLLVDDVVAGGQLERVDLLLAARRHRPHVAGRGLLAGQVLAGEDREPGRRVDEAVVEGTARHGDDARAGLEHLGVDQGGRDVVVGEHLDHPLGRAVAGVEDDDAVVGGQPAADVGDGPLEVAAVGLGDLGRQQPGLDATVAGLALDAERADAPPGTTAGEGVLADVGELAVRRGAEVDRRLTTRGRRRPAGAEELLAGRDQVVRAGADPLGVEHDHVGVRGHQVDEQLHLVDEHRGQGLHALHRDAGGDLVRQLEQLRVRLPQRGRPAAYLVGQQQLAARRRPEPAYVLQRPLVGDGEAADLLDLVAPQLDPERVLLGRREDVDDAAAHRELAPLLDQVDAGVRRRGQPLDDVVQGRGVAGRQLDRRQVTEARDLRLEERAHRGDDDVERSVGGVRAGVAQPSQHREPAADRVAARAEPLVRQRLPARVVADPGRVDEVAEGGDEVLGLPGGRRHREHRAAVLDQPRDDEGAQPGRAGQLERGEHASPGVGQRPGEDGLGEDGGFQAGEAHDFPSSDAHRTRIEPPVASDRG